MKKDCFLNNNITREDFIISTTKLISSCHFDGLNVFFYFHRRQECVIKSMLSKNLDHITRLPKYELPIRPYIGITCSPYVENEEENFDNENNTMIVEELGKSFRARGLSLTATIVHSKDGFAHAINYANLIQHLDYLHIAHIPVYPNPAEYTIDHVFMDRDIATLETTINGLVAAGVPTRKIILSLMFAAPIFETTVPNNLLTTKIVDYIGYNDICDFLTRDQERWTIQKEHNSELGLTTLKFHDRIPAYFFIVYESSRSMAVRAKLVVRRNLGGVVAFPMGLDDYLAKCPDDTDTYDDFNVADGVTLHIPTRNDKDFPLLRTINEALQVAVDERNQEAKLHH